MNIIPEYLLEIALVDKMTFLKSKQYFIAEYNSDSCIGMKKSQPGVANSDLNLSKLALANNGEFWIDADKNELNSFFELDNSINDKDELNLKLKANNQTCYIFIIDDLGTVWYEGEVDPFQQILKIDTSLFPTSNYTISIENDGLFSSKRFVKAIFK